jgi:hypothetical protein
MLQAYKVIMDEDNNRILWDFFPKLNNIQKSNGLHLANKLSDKHILFMQQKMKVSIACQTLSNSVAKALTTLGKIDVNFKDSGPTVRFIEVIIFTYKYNST